MFAVQFNENFATLYTTHIRYMYILTDIHIKNITIKVEENTI